MHKALKDIITKLEKLISYRELLRNLISRNLEVKYKYSIFGFLWSLLNPLCTLSIYTIAFSYILKVKVENFPIFLMCGLLPWSYFTTSLSMSTLSIINNRNLVQKVYFPREILPISVVLTCLIEFLLTFIILIPGLFFFNTTLSTTILYIPFLVLIETIFIIGGALLFSSLTVYLRDVKYLLDVLLKLWFWMTPIVYPLLMVPESFKQVILLNPMATFIIAYRNLLLEASIPSPAMWLKLSVTSVISLIIGYLVFQRCERNFADYV